MKYIKGLIIFIFSVALFLSCDTKQQAPNILLIVVDDLGWTDLGYTGSSFYESPNIDSFAKESFQFTNAYAAGSVCSPTRASIMTGMHPSRVNITDWIPGQNPPGTKMLGPEDLNELPLERYTLAEALGNFGYETFFAGKWHLGSEGFHPEEQGFEINLGGHHKGSPPGGYYSPYKNPTLTDGPDGEYLTDRLTDETIDFINQEHKSPFFACLSYYTVHTPIQASKVHLPYFELKLKLAGNPETETKEDGDGITRLNQNNADYASMVYAMDENVGNIVNNLKENGLYDNTIIIFTSDNGGLSTLQTVRGTPGPTSVLPLRGGKGWLHEGGIRIPMLIKPAGHDKSKSKVIETPVVSYDYFPTILSMINENSEISNDVDGKDLSALMSIDKPLDREYIYWDYPHYHGSGWKPGSAIRKGNMKLIHDYETNSFFLYDLDKDISESKDLSSEMPVVAASMKLKMEEYNKRYGAKPVIANKDYTPQSN